MAVAIQNLNGDASFLLTFEPVDDGGDGGAGRDSVSFGTAKPFRILLDPYIPESSTCISSLVDIPEPDVVIVSQHRPDHCNEATLRQLPATGTRTILLADPSSARTIRSWKYFEKGRIYTIPEWDTPGRAGSRPTVLRVGVPPLGYGEPGEMTVSLIPQKHNFSTSGLHNAIGITYRPPLKPFLSSVGRISPLRPHSSHNHLRSAYITTPLSCQTTNDLLPPTPSTVTTTSHRSLRSVRSALSLKSTTRKGLPSTPPTHDRPLSIIFSPHGIHYASIHSYVTSHLISEAALPLTALIHCFDSVEQPWWLGGNVLLGAPAGAEIATRLAAKAWISAHDLEDKGNNTCCSPSSSIPSKKLSKRTRRQPKDVIEHLKTVEEGGGGGGGSSSISTKVLTLAAGEKIVLTSEAVWNPDYLYQEIVSPSPPPTLHKEEKKEKKTTTTTTTKKITLPFPPSPPVTPTKTEEQAVAPFTTRPQQHEAHPPPPPSPVSIATTTAAPLTAVAHKSTPPPRPPRPYQSGLIIPLRPQTTTGHDFRSYYTSFANLEEVMFTDRDMDHRQHRFHVNTKGGHHHPTVTEEEAEEEEGGGGGGGGGAGGYPNMI